MSSKTAEYVASILLYDPETGHLTWKVSRGNRKRGDIAGSLNEYGYRKLKINKQIITATHAIWMLVTGEDPSQTIDHIDGNPDNNRWCNLRLATPSQQQGNKRMACNNTTGARGVLMHRGKFVARLRKKHIGTFDNFEDAKLAYVAAAREYYGEFYRDV